LGGFEVWRRYEVNGGVWTLEEERETVHVSDDARRICMVETETVSGGSAVGTPTPRYRFQLDDHLGTVAVEVDATGNVISYEQYHPYGTSAYRAQDGTLGVSAKRYRYNGKERDDETKLYYYGARYYAPWLGRWTAADPAWMVDGPNLYQYVRGSPISLGDPTGTRVQDSTGTFAAHSESLRNDLDEARLELRKATASLSSDPQSDRKARQYVAAADRVFALTEGLLDIARLHSSDETYYIVADPTVGETEGKKKEKGEFHPIASFGADVMPGTGAAPAKAVNATYTPEQVRFRIRIHPMFLPGGSAHLPTKDLNSVLLHEIHHAAQFERGIDSVTGPGVKQFASREEFDAWMSQAIIKDENYLEDLPDELEAYQLQARAFGMSDELEFAIENIENMTTYLGRKTAQRRGSDKLPRPWTDPETGYVARTRRDLALAEFVRLRGGPIPSSMVFVKGWRKAYAHGARLGR
jgi:RHS repeat-associated protein